MNASRSLGAILIVFRIRTCASLLSAQSPYTVAVKRPQLLGRLADVHQPVAAASQDREPCGVVAGTG